jgi:CRISPR system Cascade subunit CasE
MSKLHMIQATLDGRRLAKWATVRNMDADDLGYVSHALMRDAWGNLGPQPFLATEKMGRVKILGYGAASADDLRSASAEFAEPDVTACIQEVTSKEMPESWAEGRRLGFQVRVAPTRQGHHEDGRRKEADAITFESGPADREEVYRKWLATKFGTAAAVEKAEMTSFRLLTACRRSEVVPDKRPARSITLPDASFAGVLRVTNPEAFSTLIATGVGRHRAFGFGALMLRPA